MNETPGQLSRRTFMLGAAGALVLTAAAATVASAERVPAPDEPTDPPPELVAVRVFPAYATSTYGQHAAVLDRLGALGVKRISHPMSPAIAGNAAVIKFTQDAYTRFGIKSWLTMGVTHQPLSAADWDTMVAALKGPLAGMVERVYGWNEPNHVRGGGSLPPDWVSMTAAHQAQLWARVKPLGIKVGTPQLWSGTLSQHDADLRKLAPSIIGKFDHIGWHLYPRSGGAENTRNVDHFDALYKSLFGPGHQVICTEAGFLDAVNYTGGSYNDTPASKAAKMGPLVDEYVNRGYGISYFELLDDTDPTESDREASLGLIECKGITSSTWTNKPAFVALKSRLA